VRSAKHRRACVAAAAPMAPFTASVRAAASPRANRQRERKAMAERLRERYEQQIRGQLQERFGYKNVNEIPKLEKVVVNMSVGEAIVNPKALDAAVSELTAITGQKPVVAKAKKSIAAFKLRAGMNIAAKVTLRGDRMYVFVDKLFNVVLPRIRDFRGLPAKSFDGRGNYNLGLREQLVFPEINYDKVDKTRGMDVTIVTTAKTDEEASEFLVAMGLPLQKAASSTTGPQR
jgi:large subunit ribosomal protein L5